MYNILAVVQFENLNPEFGKRCFSPCQAAQPKAESKGECPRGGSLVWVGQPGCPQGEAGGVRPECQCRDWAPERHHRRQQLLHIHPWRPCTNQAETTRFSDVSGKTGHAGFCLFMNMKFPLLNVGSGTNEKHWVGQTK